MRLETFFEKFEQFADAPNAVAKMRELVLQLAVQGKLIEQDKKEGDADSLLKQIKSVKARLVKERLIKKQETDPIDKCEELFLIPESWVWTRLGEIGDWGAGSTPGRGNYDLFGGGITWLKSGELNDNQALAGSEETVTELAIKTCSFRMNRPGDILLAMYGATIGKAAILAESAVTNQAVCGCTPFEGVSNRYLFNFLLAQRALFHSASEGGAQPNISKVKIVGFPFPLPPLAEQKRIVAKVDELMALCDRLEAQQQERDTRHAYLARAALTRFADAPTPANLNLLFHPSYAVAPADIRKAILTLAVQGKLVPQDENDEPVSELRQRICAMEVGTTRRSKSTFPQTTEIEDNEKPFELPAKWEWLRLGELLPEFQNGASSRGDKGGKPVIVIRLADINNRRISLQQTREIPIDSKDISKYALRNGDILITRVNGSADIIGNFIRVETDIDAIYCDHFIRMRIDSEFMYSNYIAFIGETLLVRDQISRLFITTAGQKTVNQGHIGFLLLAVPPLAEQRRIVAKVDQLMALVERLETQLAASRAAAVNLMDAVVAELTGLG